MSYSRISVSFFCNFIAIFLLLLFLALKEPVFVCSAVGQNETDQLALFNFKAKITEDPLGVLHSWNASTHFCQWHGVKCSHRHRRVIMLDLSSSKLVGSLSPYIGNLSFLRVLNLQNNSFGQEIPIEIARLRRLEELRLQNNSISGKIPSNISSCSNLIHIAVSGNKLEGELPEEFSSLLKLVYFGAYNNNLTGSIPPSLGNLSSLDTFSVSNNNFFGSIPDSLGRLTSVTYFIVRNNMLSGVIPPSLFNLTSVTNFDVGMNQIQGILPSNMGFTLPNIENLALAFNQFTGTIPVSISNATKLQLLQILYNNFTGQLPPFQNLNRLQIFTITNNHLGSASIGDLNFLCSLTNASSLQILGLNGNKFGGVLPECISNLTAALTVLAMDNNRIFGSIPAGIGNLVNLERLDLWNNRLSGNIPPTIGKVQKLLILQLRANEISGEIPYSLGNLTLLITLDLRGNNLQGNIPSILGECQNLGTLNLAANNLSGYIPPQVIGISSLSIYLDLSQNRLTGSIPSDVSKLKNLGMLFLHDNTLTGEIPSSLGSCVRLEVLNMRGNFFQGPIPSSLSSLRGLQVLDFSDNNLSGQIPSFLASFDLLLNLNLSFNNFEGMIPIEGVFKNASATSIMANDKLCGGIPDFHLAECKTTRSINRRLSVKLKAVIATIAGLLGVTLVLTFLFVLMLRKKRQTLASASLETSLLNVSFRDLHNATNGFSAANLIGAGSFGRVYKGLLGEGGLSIAVKVLNLQHHKADRSFIAECEALRNIRHRNLVKLLTSCSSIDFQGNDFKALIYEFMVNGSLEEWLHPRFLVDGNHVASKNLNICQRLSIAIDVASALEYLHCYCGTPIVHCDLKPSNVLLNDELVGHISDFGLAKILSKGNGNLSTDQSISVGLRGTIGYAPPEYGIGNEISIFGDVYSYGILLLEMFTGLKPTNDMFKEDLNLHNFVRVALPERMKMILDPTILHEIVKGENGGYVGGSRVQDFLTSIFEIGLACSAEFSKERRNMSSVVAELQSIRSKLVKSSASGARQKRTITK